MKLIEREFEVEAGRQAAWNHLARVERWPSWAAHIRSVKLSPPDELTSETKGEFRLSNGVKSTFVMIELNPPVNWTWRGPFLWLSIVYDHRFVPLGSNRTKLVWTVDAEGFGVWVLGRLFARIYNRNLDRAVPALIREINDSVSHACNAACAYGR